MSQNKFNELAFFFDVKIKNIWFAMKHRHQTKDLWQNRNQTETVWSDGHIGAKSLEEMVKNLNPSTSSLDALPTSFFQNSFCFSRNRRAENDQCIVVIGHFPRIFPTSCQASSEEQKLGSFSVKQLQVNLGSSLFWKSYWESGIDLAEQLLKFKQPFWQISVWLQTQSQHWDSTDQGSFIWTLIQVKHPFLCCWSLA